MKSIQKYTVSLVAILLLTVSCERDTSQLPLATNYSTNPEIFIDEFSPGLDYVAWGKVTNFDLDYLVKYSGTTAMRFDVPNFGDPFGNAAGGAFQVATGRDLTGYNTLSFWAKASRVDTLSDLGFGSSSVKGISDETYKVTVNKLVLTTTWTKYYIPIPDPSKLKAEKGMFWYYVIPTHGGEGFTFWIDELKYEKLGTIGAEPMVSDLNGGKDQTLNNIETGTYGLPGLTAEFNLPSGVNQLVSFPASYLTVASSNPTVARSITPGTYSVLAKGSTLITTKLKDKAIKGTYLVNSIGDPVLPTTAAPTPTVNAANVVSLFTDNYNNAAIDSYQPGWTWSGGGFTTDFKLLTIDNNKTIRYSNFNDTYNQKGVLVAISFESTPVNISTMTHLHLDVWVPSTSPNNTNKPMLKLEDWGANYGGTSSTGIYNSPAALATDQWVHLDIPLTSFVGLSSKSHLVHVVFENFPTVIYVDNIFFHK